ncbi:hydroxyacid dehydrogenase [Candidatus Gottesmanbacteria bacterium]|nr:hydroxyacid dehydrogenase [Candidatus Gottesmanbacteria bacterium]
MKVLICDKIHPDALEFLQKKKADILYLPEIVPSELLQKVEDVEALIVRSRTKVIGGIIEKGHDLKIIARAGSGTDNIDKVAAQKKGVAVINAPGANAQAVAELTVGLMLSLLRQIPYADKSMHEGQWLKKELMGEEIYNKTVGIIGFGYVGKKVTALVRAFGANVQVVGSHDEEEKLSNLLKTSDIVSLHVRLNDKTRGLINNDKLSLMKPTAYLINNCRGEVVVEDDLYDALINKKIAGAALDVFWNEPLQAPNRWMKLSNCILTPHISGQTHEASRKACMMVVGDVVKFLQGKVINSRVI